LEQRQPFEKENTVIDLSVVIAGIKMRNPVMPASGCFGYGTEYMDFVSPEQLGALILKGTTLLLKEGNKQPRMVEVSGGIINFIGLQNPGVEVVIREKIPLLLQFDVPVGANISGNTAEEFGELADRFSQVQGVHFLEVNISCPNIKEGGVAFGQDPKMAFSVTSAVRRRTSLPIVVKLTPNTSENVVIGKAAVDGGADALSLINTLKSCARITNYPSAGKYAWVEGGLSGPCIKPIALRMVSDLVKANLGVPIIGVGGIFSTEDAIDFLERGASAIQVGTANFVNPTVMPEIIRGLEARLEQTGCQNLAEWREKGFPVPETKK